MAKRKNKHEHRINFDSVSAVLKSLNEVPPTDDPNRNASTRYTSSGDSWDLGADFDAAMVLARKGWSEVGSEVDDLLSKINISVPRQDIIRVNDVTGDEVDVGLYVQGEPEHFIQLQLGEGNRLQTSIVKVIINWTTSGGVGAEVMKTRGVFICALVRALELSGKSVAIEIVAPIAAKKYNTPPFFIPRITIKRSSEQLDPEILAFWLAHPAAFRRLIFRLYEQLPSEERDYFDLWSGRGYGNCAELPANEREESDVYISGMYLADAEQWETDEDIKNAVITELTKLNVTVN